MELTIRNITKDYRDKRAVEAVSMTITPGVWGLLGANGAGKTTLMRMIAGILKPTGGLDPGERVYFRNILSEFSKDRIVMISTHILSDVEYIAAKNAIVKDGHIIYQN